MWNYIIIGAGSAGCVLANRLSADPKTSVLVIEAGNRDAGLRYRIPLLGSILGVGNPKADWCYQTEPDPTRYDRRENWPRGKVLGGSSSINGMVYVRGNRGDYDGWAQGGLIGWSYNDLLPVFEKLEHDHDASGHYGTGGPMPISRTRGAPGIADRFLAGMAAIGIPRNQGYNGENQFGAAIADVTQKNGLRFSAARAYLDPVRSRPNLRVVTGTLVRRVLFTGTRASGVELERDGRRWSEEASGEVILSAGAINSPHLLMLSGIGDGEVLKRHDISVVRHAATVGQNLHEHPSISIQATLSVPTINTRMGLVAAMGMAAQFLFGRRGPLTHILPAIAFGKSRPELDDADLQFHLLPFGFTLGEKGVELLDRPAATIQANVNRTRSRGWLTLGSPDPKAPPHIFPNLFGDTYDLDTLIAGGRIARAVFKSPAFAPVVQMERNPGAEVETQDEWADFVRRTAGVEFHPCGTCRMGTDDGSVVDETLRVRGVEGLRVADASVIPQVPSANTNAICLAIGERAAMLIAEAR